MRRSADDAAARAAVERVARRTPVLSSRTISERAGGVVALKAENLQRTGSFKVRGASAKLAALGPEGCAHGVVAASAGNHAQALAAAAAARGVRCEVFVPADAPIAKVEAARGQGATVHIGGDSVDECIVRRAGARATRPGSRSCTRSTTPTSSPGRDRSGSSCSRTCPTSRKVVVPVGGGGLARGRRDRGEVGAARGRGHRRAGRRVRAVPRVAAARRAGAGRLGADDRRRDRGQAPGRGHAAAAGRVAGRRWSWSARTRRAEAMVVLMERCKLVVEGAGAVGVAALLGGQVRAAPRGTTVAVLSGGNVDAGLLPRSPAATRPRPAAGSCCSRACPTGPAASRGCSRCVAEAGGEHRRRLARARGRRPARARDGRRARARDARARARRRAC